MRCDVIPDMSVVSDFDFNPRTYVRCDSYLVAPFEAQHDAFQSTHLREVRLETEVDFELGLEFQSTHLREVRLYPSVCPTS